MWYSNNFGGKKSPAQRGLTLEAVILLKTVETYGNIMFNKPTRCNSGSIVFVNNYRYAVHVSDALCFHHQEHYKL